MQRFKPRLLIAEDHLELREEVARLLSGDFDVVGMAEDGAKLIDLADKLRPDVVVTDYKMPRMDGIRASASLLANGLCKAVVLLTSYDEWNLWEQARKAGILGFVLKTNAAEDLVRAIHAALEGRVYRGISRPS